MTSWASVEANLPPAALAALKRAQSKSTNTTTTINSSKTTKEQTITTTSDKNYIYDAELLSNQQKYQTNSKIQSHLTATPQHLLLQTMQMDGVVRINHVLPSDLCDALKAAVNQELTQKVQVLHGFQAAQAGTPGGFGRVYSRKNRFDLYVRNEGIYEQATRHLFEGILGDFLRQLFASNQTQNKTTTSTTSTTSTVELHPTMQTLTQTERNQSGCFNESITPSLHVSNYRSNRFYSFIPLLLSSLKS